MRNLSTIINALNDKDRERIMYAFNHGLEEHVIYAKDRYVGVNLNGHGAHLIPEFNHGVWSYGRIKRT